MIKRVLFDRIIEKVDFQKAIILLGPRQVGKTWLLKKLTEELNLPVLMINGDNPADRLLWSNPDLSLIQSLVQPYKIIVFDEAQRIENTGLTAKMIVDAGWQKQVFITGSSALELADSIQEPLTGRKWEFRLFPVAWSEMVDTYTLAGALPRLEELLIYGQYPDIIMQQDKEEILTLLAGSYLYKDILELGGIRKPEVLIRLLQALAWQVGREVSYNELSRTIGIDKETVSSYIDLLEKSFVIFRLNPLARNERKEISTSRKIYFYDNGIRNAIIQHFNPMNLRNDTGALWENFIISEKVKANAYHKKNVKTWFWRSKAQAEIDLVEEKAGSFTAYELKWNEHKKARFSTTFTDFYQPMASHVIHPGNFWQFL